jgi:hypothetical protein
VGWPLSSLMEAHIGWRGACFAWAGLHVLLGLPLNALLPRNPELPAEAAAAPGSPAPPVEMPPRYTAAVLALLFSMLGFVSTSMAAHLPALLQAGGATLAVAVLAGALIGPSQVAARIVEFSLLKRFSPLLSARLASLTHPLGAGVLLALGPVAALPFAVLHGTGNGLLTIVRGTLPLALFGAQGYGARQGWIALPGRVLGAASPWLFGLVLERYGARALWLSGGMCVTAFLCLSALRLPRHV